MPEKAMHMEEEPMNPDKGEVPKDTPAVVLNGMQSSIPPEHWSTQRVLFRKNYKKSKERGSESSFCRHLF
jgi:hypothetical protein